jgi:hypothetical protein
MNESFTSVENKKPEKITIMQLMAKIGFPITESVTLDESKQKIIEGSAKDEGWQPGIIFDLTSDTDAISAESLRLKNDGYELKINRIDTDNEDDPSQYVLLFRKKENIDLDALPSAIVLSSENELPQNIAKLNVSQELKNMFYKNTTKVSEAEQIKTLINLGHTILFQEVGEVDGVKEGLYYLANEESPQFDYGGGSSLKYAVGRMYDHIKNQNI